MRCLLLLDFCRRRGQAQAGGATAGPGRYHTDHSAWIALQYAKEAAGYRAAH